MKLILQTENPLRGEISLPGDKSTSHRAALFASLAEGNSRFYNYLEAGVTRKMLAALSDLGVSWKLNEGILEVNGFGRLGTSEKTLDCGNSATTLRLLAGALAGAGIDARLDGSEGLRKRPMGRIIRPLAEMGVQIQSENGMKAPISIKARNPGEKLFGLHHHLEVASAQVKTCILLAGLGAGQPTTVIEPGPSRDHSERMLRAMGVDIAVPAKRNITLTPKEAPLKPIEIHIPGDFSSAAFLIVAALVVPGSKIRLLNVGLNPTRTGLLDVLLNMGAKIRIFNRRQAAFEPVGDLLVEYSQLQATQVHGDLVVRMIDEFPVFSIAACVADGNTEIKDAGELRHKETDRIKVLCAELDKLGVNVRERPDGMLINGNRSSLGGLCDANKDHRLAMSLALIGLFSPKPVCVNGAEIIRESFPGYMNAMEQLGATVQELNSE